MSFSSDVKKELAQQCPRKRHCMIAELAGILFYTNVRVGANEVPAMPELAPLEAYTNVRGGVNEATAEKYLMLLERAFDIEFSELKNISPGDRYRILGDLRLLDEDVTDAVFTGRCCDEELVRRTCCKRAFIRGAFLAAGSMSDPRRSYHFEIACRSAEQAAQMRAFMADFGVEARVVKRKTYHMLYVKDSEQVVDLLNIMEAYVSLMKLENVRIVRQMRGSVNRRVNCETANIQKTVDAAVRQVEDIELIRDMKGLDSLSPALRQMAYARLEWPDATLQELGEKMDPPVGKSGVNHRLRKLSQIAEELRRV